MTEYCRLCAELKDLDEIVTSIDDVEQLMERKLRACCQWTTENTEHRLPHSVCSACLDKLEKCWLFSQSVQLAQQRLLEIFENDTEWEASALNIGQSIEPAVEKSNFRCHLCHKSFGNARSLQSHSKYQNRNKCEVCLHQFCIASELTLHRQQGCEGLIEISSTVAVDRKVTAVDLHLEYHAESDEHLAIGDRFETNESDASQTDLRDADENFAEENCSRTDDSTSFRCDHNPSLKRKGKSDQSKGQIECADCDRTFATKKQLNAHRRYAHFEKNCKKREDCGESFLSHRRQLKAAHIERQFECWLCHKELRARRGLTKHLKTHTHKRQPKAKRLICEQCGKGFSCASHLNEHTSKEHSDERPFKCAVCGLGYKTKTSLRKHRISHREFEHKCTQCDRAFRKKQSLTVHMETHTGVVNKPNICDVCGRGFRRNYELLEHRRIHTGEKPFTTFYLLPFKPYSCDQCCDVSFRAMSSFYDHLKKKHGISVSARNREEQARATAMSSSVASVAATIDEP